METIGKLIKVRDQYYVTIPVEVQRHWRKMLMEEVDIVSMSYDESSLQIVIYPRQINKSGILRKIIKRGDTWLITIPKNLGLQLEENGIRYLKKLYDEKLLKFVIAPL